MARLLAGLGLALMLALAACESGGNTTEPQFAGGSVIQWDRSPQTVVFRADVEGGENTFLRGNDIPLCTIYGDNRVVWTNVLGEFNVQVLEDRLTDQQIQDYISYLTIVQQFFNYQGQADMLPPSAIPPVVETLYVAVNGREHKSDAFAEWPPDYFQTVVNACKALSRAPVLVAPSAAWVTVREVDYNPSVPMLLWEGEAASLNLGELAAAGEARWLEGQNVRVLWNLLRNSSPITRFLDENGAYEIVVAAPGVNRSAPPPPQ
jgi:hypothetical protein